MGTPRGDLGRFEADCKVDAVAEGKSARCFLERAERFLKTGKGNPHPAPTSGCQFTLKALTAMIWP